MISSQIVFLGVSKEIEKVLTHYVVFDPEICNSRLMRDSLAFRGSALSWNLVNRNDKIDNLKFKEIKGASKPVTLVYPPDTTYTEDNISHCCDNQEQSCSQSKHHISNNKVQ